MVKEVDARGLACPQPVITTKQALDAMDEGVVVAIVDSEVARDNVVKMAKNLACQVTVEERANGYHIKIIKGTPVYTEGLATASGHVMVITRDVLGGGSEELGKVLMRSFFYSLASSETPPQTLVFLNGGVKLATEGSEVIEHLLSLQQHGVEILACGTCLDYFKLKEKLCVGSVTNMYSIIEHLNKAKKVTTF